MAALPSPECMHSCGMNIVVDRENPDVDVVFVHGFTGHPYRTWVSKTHATNSILTPEPDADHHTPPAKRIKFLGGKKQAVEAPQVYWPRDLLPSTLPRARVLAYGYDTKLRHGMGPQGSQSTIFGYAKELLDSLNDQRSSSKKRPLMFIVHSLGGIVVKEALRQARRYDVSPVERDLYEIFQSTFGIMFFGTPHRGADPRGLFHRVIQEVIGACGVSANKHVVNALMPDSERLKELLVEFGSLAQSRNWIICSFQEQHGVRALGGRKVVEDISSCLGDGRIEKIRPIDANHMDMCRFSDPNDPQYLKVTSALHTMIGHQTSRASESPDPGISADGPSEPVESRRLTTEQLGDLVQRLKFDQIDARLANLKPPKAKTCNWVLKTPNYIQWRSIKELPEHHGFFWIKGKPGAGKSILMKYLFSNAKRAFPQARTISFFFNARGEHLERSTIGLYRSLLWQIFEKAPELQWVLGEVLGNSEVQGGEWTIQVLKNVFELVVEQLRDQQLTCYIDALDECPEDEIRDMVCFLEDICSKAVDHGSCLRICFASRHYPHITIKRGLHMVLENENKHTEDIQQYIESELSIGGSEKSLYLKERLISKAEGVFLWVALVIPMLNKAYDHGKLRAAERKLQELPPKLSDLFHDILTRDWEDRDGLLLSIQWVLFAKRPMKLQELYFAIEAGRDSCDVEDLQTVPDLETEYLRLSLLSTSKGLVEETRSKNPTMQFIHESVRDYLLKERGLVKLWSDLGENFVGTSNERLSKCCLRQVQLSLNALDVGSKTDENKFVFDFPFSEYASQNVLFHSDVSESLGVSQSEFVANFPISLWIRSHNIFESKKSRRYQPDTSLLYVLAEQNLVNLAKLFQDRTQHLDIKSGRYRLPFLAAFACGNREVAQYLGHQYFLDIEPRITITRGEDTFPSILLSDRKIAIKDSNLEAAFARLGCATALEYLILQGQVSGLKGTHGTDLATITKSSHVFRVLLHYGLDPNSRNSNAQPILFSFLHARPQPLECLKMVVSNGKTDLYAVDGNGDTALHSSLRSYLEKKSAHQVYEVFEYVLQHFGIDVNTKNKRGHTPLSYAAEAMSPFSHWATKLLLQCNELKPDLKDNDGRTPLSWAAGFNRLEVVKLLIGLDTVDPNSRDENGRTPLLWAASSGELEVAKLLIGLDTVDPDSRDKNGPTPLSWAAGFNKLEVVKLLIGLDTVDPDSRDENGRTPLSWVAGSGILEVTKLLLRYAKTPDAADSEGLTPLMYAAKGPHLEIIALLIKDSRITLNKLDSSGRNALHIVCTAFTSSIYEWAERFFIVKLLLSTGAFDLSQADFFEGATPLTIMQFNLEKTASKSDDHIIIEACVQLLKQYHETGAFPEWAQTEGAMREYLEHLGLEYWAWFNHFLKEMQCSVC